MSAWLTIIGCSGGGLSDLAPSARLSLDRAEFVHGPARLMDDPVLVGKSCFVWASPISASIDRILTHRGRHVCVLATGDPMHYGVGASLARHVSSGEMRVIPSPSAFSLAAARLAWPLQDVECVSLHGRPVALIERFIAPHARIIALGEGGKTVSQVADRLLDRGFEQSRLIILEHMGGNEERVIELTPVTAKTESVADFSTLAIECIAGDHIAASKARVASCVPGLPHDLFRHDGQLTKSDVRAVTLAALAPYAGACLWDVGAGCGSVSIEWLRAARGGRAVAVERDVARLEMIAENATALGVPHLDIVSGRAPDALCDLPVPDAVFIGGAVACEAVFEACWDALRPNGILVANAVTLEGEAALIARQDRHGGTLVRIDVSCLTDLRSYRVLKPGMSVLQWRVCRD